MMNDHNRNDLARNAWLLYKLAIAMQKTMLEMFFDEFCDIDEKEENVQYQREDLPF
jgi:hypothetical protein